MTVDKEAILKKIYPFMNWGEMADYPLYNKKGVFVAMDEYAASLIKERDELKDKVEWWKKETNTYREGCRNRDAQIGELNLSNEAKEKRIEELTEALANTEKGYEIFRDKSEKQKQEIERLKGLIDTMYNTFIRTQEDTSPAVSADNYRRFKEANNL